MNWVIERMATRNHGMHAAVWIGILGVSALQFLACGSSNNSSDTSAQGGSGGTGGSTCDGVVNEEGVCEPKCVPDSCIDQNVCVDNECKLTCDSHRDCTTGTQDCTAATVDDSGESVNVCESNGKAQGFGESCSLGTECATYTEATFVCHGAGEGDADAYCTINDCASDADCPGGYACAINRDPHEICDNGKGDNGLCGETDEDCIDSSTFGDGNTYFEGSMCLLHYTCLKRTQCDPCTTDLDCSQFDTQKCIDIGGEMRCARDCNTDDDCDPDYECSEGKSCVPRFGACTGNGGFCEPCVNDEDCGSSDTHIACVDLSGGMKGCYDYDELSSETECESDNDCPESPSGKHGECLDENEGVTTADSYYHRCYVPYNSQTNKFSCW